MRIFFCCNKKTRGFCHGATQWSRFSQNIKNIIIVYIIRFFLVPCLNFFNHDALEIFITNVSSAALSLARKKNDIRTNAQAGTTCKSEKCNLAENVTTVTRLRQRRRLHIRPNVNLHQDALHRYFSQTPWSLRSWYWDTAVRFNPDCSAFTPQNILSYLVKGLCYRTLLFKLRLYFRYYTF